MTISWLAPIGQARRIVVALQSMLDETRATHGCLGCSISTRINNRAVVRYVEEWRTEEDLRHRVGSRAFRSVSALMEYAVKPPRIEFILPSGTRGLEFVEDMHSESVQEIRRYGI